MNLIDRGTPSRWDASPDRVNPMVLNALLYANTVLEYIVHICTNDHRTGTRTVLREYSNWSRWHKLRMKL